MTTDTDTEPLTASWKLLHRTASEEQSPETVNLAVALERLAVAVRRFAELFPDRIKTSYPVTVSFDYLRSGGDSWICKVEALELKGNVSATPEKALEALLVKFTDLTRATVEESRRNADELEAKLLRQKDHTYEVQKILRKMGTFNPDQPCLPEG